jgi:CxxC motif-containing protein (DUF1111 family)
VPRRSARALLLPAIAALAACDPQREASPSTPEPTLTLVREDPSDAPLAGLTADERVRFVRGDAHFEEPFAETQGLGPHYVHRSCTSCHEDDARGPGVVRRIVAPEGALPHGDVVRPRLAAGARTAIAAPEGARTVVRLGPAVFARGLLEAIPDETILAHEAAQAAAGGPISGRAARLASSAREPASLFGDAAPRLGRFGHQARAATLESFVADALLGDMGLTSPARPDELSSPDGLRDDLRPGPDVDAETVALLADYVRFLAIPARIEPDPHGAALFERVGCADCHVPTARTRADHPVEALRDREVALYTDVLLHDLGEGLDDGLVEGAAEPREWRTAPLVGVRFLRGLLHDGRAETVAEAIAAHASEGSEANDVVARFEALAPDDQRALIGFVEAL